MDIPMNNSLKINLVGFLVLFRRLVSESDCGLYMYVPISKMNINFERAVKRAAVLKEKFWFRKFYSKKFH